MPYPYCFTWEGDSGFGTGLTMAKLKLLFIAQEPTAWRKGVTEWEESDVPSSHCKTVCHWEQWLEAVMEHNIALYRGRYRQIEREAEQEKRKNEFWCLCKSTAKVSYLQQRSHTILCSGWAVLSQSQMIEVSSSNKAACRGKDVTRSF